MMKTLCLTLCLLPLAALAQQTPTATVPSDTASAAPRMYISAGEIADRIAKADAAARAGTAYDGGPLLLQGVFKANMEYHVGAAPRVNVHLNDAELFVVLEGSGTLTLGGTLVNPTRNGSNLQASAAEGGVPYKLSKGDMVLIPENLAHSVTQTDGKLVLMSMHLPQPAAASTPVAR
jgi:mannose-6-phosphate isomerase-like protein (cupin superfamily)